MYGKRFRKFFILLTSTLLVIPQTFASADIKKVGRTTSSITVNTILSGKGAPSASLGINGDFYIDKINLNFYGPKTNGLWPVPVSMRGPAGATGNDGKNGVDGKPGATTVAAGGGSASVPGPTGPTGPQGPAGAKGDQGDPGPAGPAGVAGPQGATGLTGSTGPAGPQGSQGAQGLKGDQGQQGPTGDSGLTGPAGPQGPAGPSGLPGIPGAKGDQGEKGAKGDTGSNASVPAIYGTISFPQINLVSPNMASTATFGKFDTGKFYLVNIFISAHTQFYDIFGLKFSLLNSLIPCFYTSTSGNSAIDGVDKTYTSIHAMALVDGNALSPDSLTAKITNYSEIPDAQISFTANYVALEVGSMTQI